VSLSDLLPATLRTRSPISRLNDEREAICREVVERVARRVAFESATRLEYTVEALLSEAAHVELARMEERGLPADKQLYWRKLAQTVSRARDEDSLEELRRVSEKYATDAIGHFSQAAYWLATGLVPAGIALALSSEARWSMLGGGGSLSGLADRVRIEGNLEHLRRLAQRGTLVFVPTHSSHMDETLFKN
jgi:glycerol-3-phosphate O-acyltransferase